MTFSFPCGKQGHNQNQFSDFIFILIQDEQKITYLQELTDLFRNYTKLL